MTVYIKNNKLLKFLRDKSIKHGFVMNDTKEQLEKSISFIKHRLKKFTEDELLTKEGNEIYNQLLIKKAVMEKELKQTNENKLENFTKKLCRKISGKTLICDHF